MGSAAVGRCFLFVRLVGCGVVRGAVVRRLRQGVRRSIGDVQRNDGNLRRSKARLQHLLTDVRHLGYIDLRVKHVLF